MKSITAKSGLIITLLLVSVLMAYGFWSQRSAADKDACSASGEAKSEKVESKLNLNGMTRHLLDFYK
jgi:hypothetical protein